MILKEGRNKQGQILVYMLASNSFASLCDVLFFTVLEVLLLLIFSYFISYNHRYLCLGLSHYINMWFLCNY